MKADVLKFVACYFFEDFGNHFSRTQGQRLCMGDAFCIFLITKISQVKQDKQEIHVADLGGAVVSKARDKSIKRQREKMPREDIGQDRDKITRQLQDKQTSQHTMRRARGCADMTRSRLRNIISIACLLSMTIVGNCWRVWVSRTCRIMRNECGYWTICS